MTRVSTMRLAGAAAVAAALVLAGRPAAQSGAPASARAQARDAAVVVTGTAILSGRVVSDDADARPLRRVAVNVGGSAPGQSRVTVTDDDGRFVITDLPAGRYTLTAARPPWVMTYYGSRLPGRGPGVPIAVTDGQHVADITIRMPRGAVLAGRILDADGRPLPGARTAVLQPRTIGGQRTLTSAPLSSIASLLSQTDDEGAFRLWGLAPGEYVIGASAPALGGRLTTPDEVAWALAPPGARNAPGLSGGAPMPPPGPSMTYAPVYYPGTTDADAAAVITLGPGEERTGIDFAMQYVATARVEGRLTRADGLPPRGAQIQLTQPTMVSAIGLEPTSTRTNVMADGSFILPSVRPGRYTLMARASSQAARPAAGGRGATREIPDLWASTEIVVDGTDIANLALTLQPGMKVSGRLVFDTTTLDPPADQTRTRIQLTPPRSAMGAGPLTMQVAPANADGTFLFEGVVPDTYMLLASLPTGAAAAGGGWLMRSVSQGGRDITDQPIVVRAGQDIDDLVVTFTDQVGEINGRLLDANDRPAPEYFVFVLPAERAAWHPGSARLRPPTRPASDGSFRIAPLLSGDYYLAALTTFEGTEILDPSFLEQVVASAIRITLGAGEKKTQDVKIKGS